MKPANILKIESLDENWSDKDIIMLHACFQLLKNCVEKENLLAGHVDWSNSMATKTEIEELYDWWKSTIEKDHATDSLLTKDKYQEESDMLIRLIKIRKYLWT